MGNSVGPEEFKGVWLCEHILFTPNNNPIINIPIIKKMYDLILLIRIMLLVKSR